METVGKLTASLLPYRKLHLFFQSNAFGKLTWLFSAELVFVAVPQTTGPLCY